MAIDVNGHNEWKNENIYSFNVSPEEKQNSANKITTHNTYEMNLLPLKHHKNVPSCFHQNRADSIKQSFARPSRTSSAQFGRTSTDVHERYSSSEVCSLNIISEGSTDPINNNAAMNKYSPDADGDAISSSYDDHSYNKRNIVSRRQLKQVSMPKSKMQGRKTSKANNILEHSMSHVIPSRGDQGIR